MEIIATVAGVITSRGMIFGMIFAVYKWFLKQEKQDKESVRSRRSNRSSHAVFLPACKA